MQSKKEESLLDKKVYPQTAREWFRQIGIAGTILIVIFTIILAILSPKVRSGDFSFLKEPTMVNFSLFLVFALLVSIFLIIEGRKKEK